MRTINDGYVSAGKACLMIDVSLNTLTRWYKWWENDKFEKPEGLYLPPYYHKDRRKTKFFKQEDIPALRKFGKALNSTHKGAMSDFNAARCWGKRGDKILEKKGIEKNDIKSKF